MITSVAGENGSLYYVNAANQIAAPSFMFNSFPAFSMDTFDERTPEGWIAVEHESISYNVELIVDIQLT